MGISRKNDPAIDLIEILPFDGFITARFYAAACTKTNAAIQLEFTHGIHKGSRTIKK